MLIECDGTEREVSAEERLALDQYNEVSRKWSRDLSRIVRAGRESDFGQESQKS